MSNKRKARAPRRPEDSPRYLGVNLAPPWREIHWTPLEMLCGCVIDWGWGGPDTIDPHGFITWCVRMPDTNCPWHGAETGEPVAIPRDQPIQYSDGPDGKRFLYARRARGADVRLGQRLSRELRQFLKLWAEDGDAGVIASAPHYARRLRGEGEDPVMGIVQAQMCDLILNRGGSETLKAIDEFESRRLPGESTEAMMIRLRRDADGEAPS